MALSYYSNWGPLDHLNQEMSTTTFSPQMQSDLLPPLPPELLNFHDNFLYSDTCIDPLFEQNDLLFYPDTYTNYPALNCLPPAPPPPTPAEVLDPYPYPKRVKTQEDYFYYSDLNNTQYDVFVPNPPLLPEFSPELVVPLPEFRTSNTIPAMSTYDYGSSNNLEDHEISSGGAKNGGNGGGSLSAQSMAARLRRRKISEKTQELGKLIPGGQKMNTAEMFQAASKYIKFLQTQVGILELIGSTQENEEKPLHSPELHALVTSPLMQEKLYSAEKCLVPRKFVEKLADKRELKSNPQLIKDIIQLL